MGLSGFRVWLIPLLSALVVGSGVAAAARWSGGAPPRALGKALTRQQQSYNVELVGQIGDFAHGFAVRGGFGYVAGNFRGLRVINLADAANPVEVARLALPGLAANVALSGGYAFVSALPTDVRIVDVSLPSAPREVGFFSTPTTVGSVAFSGGYAYAGTMDGLRIFDVSNPAAPLNAGSFTRPGAGWQVLRKMVVAGTYLYVTGADSEGPTRGLSGLRIIDVSTPAKPREVAFYGTTQGLALGLDGPRAYVADIRGLSILDVTDPLNPRAVGFHNMGLTPTDLAVSGNYAYVGDADGLHVIDVSNFAAPREVGFYDTASDVVHVSVAEPYVYLSILFAGGVSEPFLVLRFSGGPQGPTRQAFLPEVLHGAVGP